MLVHLIAIKFCSLYTLADHFMFGCELLNNRWRVPVPIWYHPSELQDHMNDKREDRANGLQTRYVNGIKFVLK
jgi:hypothetical protein